MYSLFETKIKTKIKTKNQPSVKDSLPLRLTQ